MIASFMEFPPREAYIVNHKNSEAIATNLNFKLMSYGTSWFWYIHA